jgi:cell division protein FtsW (lipid II flippase)
MALTKSTSASRTGTRRVPELRASGRNRELLLSLAAALAIGLGFYFAYRSKSDSLVEADRGLASRELLNLNELSAREDLLPVLNFIPNINQRQEIARNIYYLTGALPNVGRIRGLLSGEQFRYLKPRLVVRRPERFRRSFLIWTGLFVAAFLLVHIFWRATGFGGDQMFLPVLLLLSGAGMILMISLRDPVRDQLLFVDFAQGVIGGCVLLAILSRVDYERLFGKLSFVPLLASLLLSALLVLFGSGPGTSDAKVNLFGFQPVELIRILLVFFLAGYFAPRWDVLRHAVERRPSLPAFFRALNIPPLEYTLPVLICVALSLIFFFVQKDMGPALVFACLFLTLYGVARASAFLPAVGLLLVALGFAAGYAIGIPHTVGDRVSMWLSPWDNLVRGGDQLAHSLWAFATGGPAGMGVGLGNAQVVPAAHTDLILSALGEEFGFVGVAAVLGLYAFLISRALRIAGRARSDYAMFLATGLAAVTALQILLIAGGSLGVLPLSGVVTPFLSYGRSAMLANFSLVAILVSISARVPLKPAPEPRHNGPFAGPIFTMEVILGTAGTIMLTMAAIIQAVNGAQMMGRGALVMQADGVRRFQYNPRFQDVMRIIPKGSIYDRNGLPLATSDWEELEKHRAEYRALGIDIDRTCSRTDIRHYPFGGLMFDLLGDLRTRIRWGASNTAFIERDSARRLRGFDDRPAIVDVYNPILNRQERVVRYDYRELVPLVRHRFQPQHPDVRRVLERPRDVRTSIDARLQVKTAEILRKALQQAQKDKGAAVVMDPSTGDLLAAVSMPFPPEQAGETEPDSNPYLDRARYGLYPPGSTFKVVTAMAALRVDPQLAQHTYQCIRLPDGRVGNFVNSTNRPIRDDIRDTTPHGTVNMERGLVVSCNAYFAQLGSHDVGSKKLFETANLLGIQAANPNTEQQLRASLPQSSYGQGQVVASPFQMARVAATVANGGTAPTGRWLTDENNTRTTPPQTILPADTAQTLARYLRAAVTSGTGHNAAATVPIAGKTGTAELEGHDSHAWFIGFAPYGVAARKIAFSVLIENGVYGGTAAAPAAGEIVNAAVKLGLIQP